LKHIQYMLQWYKWYICGNTIPILSTNIKFICTDFRKEKKSEASTDIFFHLLFWKMTWLPDHAILNISSGISWAGEIAIVDVLHTNYLIVSFAWEKRNIWRVKIGLLPVIVNFCKHNLFVFNHVIVFMKWGYF
jgi:hypothetical protein